jgi:hypothetical protein
MADVTISANGIGHWTLPLDIAIAHWHCPLALPIGIAH